jgi:hypothetical protein
MSNNKQQTAVEWYSDKLLNILGESVNNFTKEQTLANHYAIPKLLHYLRNGKNPLTLNTHSLKKRVVH